MGDLYRLQTSQRRLTIQPAAELERLSCLSAITQEAHCLTSGLTGRNARACPDESLIYEDKERGKEYTFPPGTSLSVPTLVVHTNESLFPNPWTFNPYRWVSPTSNPYATDTHPTKEHVERNDEMSELIARRRRSMLSFMRGLRACIGRHLANAEIAVFLSDDALGSRTVRDG